MNRSSSSGFRNPSPVYGEGRGPQRGGSQVGEEAPRLNIFQCFALWAQQTEEAAAAKASANSSIRNGESFLGTRLAKFSGTRGGCRGGGGRQVPRHRPPPCHSSDPEPPDWSSTRSSPLVPSSTRSSLLVSSSSRSSPLVLSSSKSSPLVSSSTEAAPRHQGRRRRRASYLPNAPVVVPVQHAVISEAVPVQRAVVLEAVPVQHAVVSEAVPVQSAVIPETIPELPVISPATVKKVVFLFYSLTVLHAWRRF